MNEGRNSLLECAQRFQAYMLGSYPTDNIIHISVIILKSDHTFNKKTSYLWSNI